VPLNRYEERAQNSDIRNIGFWDLPRFGKGKVKPLIGANVTLIAFVGVATEVEKLATD